MNFLRMGLRLSLSRVTPLACRVMKFYASPRSEELDKRIAERI